MRQTIYTIISCISFAAFVLYYLNYQIPHVVLLMIAMFFAILYKLEELKK